MQTETQVHLREGGTILTNGLLRERHWACPLHVTRNPDRDANGQRGDPWTACRRSRNRALRKALGLLKQSPLSSADGGTVAILDGWPVFWIFVVLILVSLVALTFVLDHYDRLQRALLRAASAGDAGRNCAHCVGGSL